MAYRSCRARHFDRIVLTLPIPLFAPAKPLHIALADLAERAERTAAEVPLKEGEHFTRARRRIRDALTEAGIAPEIDRLVAELLDAPSPIAGGDAKRRAPDFRHRRHFSGG